MTKATATRPRLSTMTALFVVALGVGGISSDPAGEPSPERSATPVAAAATAEAVSPGALDDWWGSVRRKLAQAEYHPSENAQGSAAGNPKPVLPAHVLAARILSAVQGPRRGSGL